jgi:RNA polymerase sigma-70 factor (ECF subfamily)
MSVEEQAFNAYRSGPTPERLVALLRTQQDRIYNLCFQVLRQAQDAEDAAQKVLLKLVQGLGALSDLTAVRRWLYRVSVTTALDLRTERARRRIREREVALMKPVETPSQPEGEGDVLTAIGSLDADLGDLILRHYFEKSTLKELAAERQVSEVAVWKRLEKGKERLRELLSTPASAFSMAALDLRLTSIIPVSAPAAWSAVAVAAKTGAGVLGGLAVAAKTGVSTKLVAACIGLAAAVLGGGLVFSVRARQEAAREREEAARLVAKNRAKTSKSEAERPGSAASTPTAPAAAPKVASALPTAAPGPSEDELREKLRKMAQLTIKAKGTGKVDVTADPETTKAIMAFVSEFGPTLQNPSSNPARFSQITRLSLEVIFEELGLPLSQSQKTSMVGAFERMRTQLEDGRSACPQDRTIGDLRAYHDLNDGLKALSEEQIAKLSQVTNPATMFPVDGTRTALLNMVQDPSEEIAREWITEYELGEVQKSAIATAARTYVEAWERVDRQFEAQYGHRPGEKPAGSSLTNFVDQAAAVVDYSIATFEAQREALRQLEGALTPEQTEKIRGKVMVQFKRGIVITQTNR